MACDPNPASFTVTGTSDGTVAGADSGGEYFWSASTPECTYHYTVSYSVTINGSTTKMDTPIGAFFASASGSTTSDLTGVMGGPLIIGWEPSGPPFSVPSGETATLNYTLDSVDPPPACWTITGIKKNGKKWQRIGPNRVPSKIRIPKDVDPRTCVIIEDGILVPKNRYELINEG